MTSNQPLDHLAALAAAATPGPWHLTDSSAIVAPLTADTIADVWEPTAASRNGEFIEAARDAIPALVDEVHRLRAELADQRAETQKLIRWHGEDETAMAEMRSTIQRLRARTLTESEHDRAWHAIEGAAGEDGADPGTVLNAVLRALRINAPTTPAARSAAV